MKPSLEAVENALREANKNKPRPATHHEILDNVRRWRKEHGLESTIRGERRRFERKFNSVDAAFTQVMAAHQSGGAR